METLVKRIQDGSCTPEEVQLFNQWLQQLDLQEQAGDVLPAEQITVLKDRMHRQLMQELQGAKLVRLQRRTAFRRYAVAAAIVLTLGAGLLFWLLTGRSTDRAAQLASSRTIIDNNQRVVRKITMPDGTVIWLNSQSRLEFDQKLYNLNSRHVKLYGEGFFEVAKDTMRPFVVETGDIETRVLGTAFNIEAWQEESEIRVSLVHGKVALKNTTNVAETVLLPDHTMRYSKKTGVWTVLPMSVDHIKDWTTGALVFNEVPLDEALQRVAVRYHLRLEYDHTLVQHKRITASFPAGDWQAALHNILFVHGLKYDTTRGRVVITH